MTTRAAPETALARGLGFPGWSELVTAMRGGQRFTIALPPNGDASVDAFNHWQGVLARDQLFLLADGKGGASLGLRRSFPDAEVHAAHERMAEATQTPPLERPPWVLPDGKIDPAYLPQHD